MDEQTITITTELFNMMVVLLTELPYQQVVGVIARMAEEVEAQEQPKIAIN